ncbi:MAG: sodium/proline symporter [Planctomycetota bacterium]|jgi:sodium/proline symporter|nr:sodium/proline symporter [Planctomycetota bacterium]MDP6762793.1 sodium/proline symporter [Planctomycetota bacterium]MDP6988330.1 sodium/proline symporter [Planctomycetota bacterium]
MDNLGRLSGCAVYLIALLVIGWAASRRVRGLRDYLVAGKRLNFLSVAFSARATGESAWLLLGLTGMGAAVGVRAFWVVVGEVLGVGLCWLWMARPFKRLTDEYDSITIPDYLESRFADTGHRLRLVSALALMVFVTIYVSAQIDATGQAFERFLGWNYFLGAILGFGVVLLYTTFGGFLAVVWSDVFQGLMMFGGLVTLPLVGLWSIGGLGELAEGLGSIDPSLLSIAPEGGWSLTGAASIIGLTLIGLGFLGSPQIFARFLALRSEDEIARGATVALSWTLLADSGAVCIGLLARHTLGIEGEDALPGLTEHLMPTVVVGLYVAIVLAAIMSTADSLLIVATSALVRDVKQKILNPTLGEEELMTSSRTATAVLALIALTIALTVALVTPGRTVFWFVIFGWSGIAATFCPTMILSLFWRGMNRQGALWAMVAGFCAVPLFKFGAPRLPGEAGLFFANLGELPPSFLLSAGVGWMISSLSNATR